MSYYGTLRSGVMFLLKQCQVCALNASKRYKSCTNSIYDLQPLDPGVLSFLNIPDMQYENEMFSNQRIKIKGLFGGCPMDQA